MRTLTKSRARPSSRGTAPAHHAAYVERINLAIDHIVAHLAHPKRLRLHLVARVAMLSPFHFHRVFQAIVGETVADFVKRLRLDRALLMMAHAPRSSLTTIALRCGFASSSDFSRSFKQRFRIAPSAFDINAWRDAHRADLESKIPIPHASCLHVTRLPKVANSDGFRVTIRELPQRSVAYIRVRDPYRKDAVTDATKRLLTWAEREGIADHQWLGFQWDNPEITPLEHCQYHVAVEIGTTKGGRATLPYHAGEIGRFTFPAMTVAQVEVRGDIHLELRALQWLFGSWLPKSGYVPDDHPCFEAWIGRPFAHGSEHFELHAHLPIRRG